MALPSHTRLRDLLWKGEGQRFFEGEIVRINHDLLRGADRLVIPFWQLRTAQQGPRAYRYFSQAVPIGCWPCKFTWIEECQLEPTSVTWPLLDFCEQEELFIEAGRGDWHTVRRHPCRDPLPAEHDLVERLDALGVPCRGVPATTYRALLAAFVD